MNEILTVKEVAERLRTSQVQIRKMIQSGELPAVMVGREYRIPVEAMKAFIANNLEETNQVKCWDLRLYSR